ncbi:MAG TPA: PilZ domain-containing protein [Candidatus Angelobacter sp.]|nr:PilZ domain-containing protein [Candidatus Angelobacter sp.]
MEPFSALLVCNDPTPLSITQKVLEDHGITVKAANSASTAGQLLKSFKFDLAIYDHDIPGALDLATEAGKSPTAAPAANPKMVFAMVRSTTVSELSGKRIHFMMQKPFSADLLSRTLRAAYGTMIRERRVAFRHPVQIKPESSALLQETGNQALHATIILDLSQTGVCIQTLEILPQGATVQIDFYLPETKELIHATGTVMWTRASGRSGIRFAQLPQTEQKQLNAWLDSRTPYDADTIPRVFPPATRHERGAHEMHV